MSSTADRAAIAALNCYVLSRRGLEVARRVAAFLPSQPWRLPHGERVARCRLFAPARMAEADVIPFEDLSALLAQEYREVRAHLFIGAAGIAVRVLAPLLQHKSVDPPVLVMDPCGQHIVSLLSGHWGGGNALTRHLARGINATAVITTASDRGTDKAIPQGNALDEFLRDCGLRIVDWQQMPGAQAAVLEGERLDIWDPCGLVPRPWPPYLQALPGESEPLPDGQERTVPLLTAHWRTLPAGANVLRITAPCLHIGLGCRRGIPEEAALAAILSMLQSHGLEARAIAGLATVTDKAEEPALCRAAEGLQQPLRHFPARRLAACPVPHPSPAAGKRFGQKPFSVCEAAALIAAGPASRLIVPKTIVDGCLTVAIALSACPASPSQGEQPCNARRFLS
ncbi:MAG: cobalamin biosynthesis protein [Desulfovibrionaceae bacterium]|nr:cobalamin biosynthesis protein [Desulfovibrionaceae bacterium]